MKGFVARTKHSNSEWQLTNESIVNKNLAIIPMCLSFLICCKHGYNVKWNFVRDLISIASCAAWIQDHNNTFVFAILYQKNALLNPTLYTMTNTYNNVIKSTKCKRENSKLHDRHKSGVQKKKRHQRATLWPLNRITTYYYIRRFFLQTEHLCYIMWIYWIIQKLLYIVWHHISVKFLQHIQSAN